MYLPNNLINIGFKGFAECYHLTTVVTNEGLKTIYDLAFSNCENLRSINLPYSLEAIHYMAFNYCFALKSITILQNVNYIEDGAFRACIGLEHISIFRLTPPPLRPGLFNGVNLATCILTIPSGVDVLNAYKSTAQWQDFANILQSTSPVIYNNIGISVGSGGSVIYNNKTLTSSQDFSILNCANMSLTINPNNGYEINSIIDLNYLHPYDLKSELINNQFSFNACSPRNLIITFNKIQYRLSLKDASSGTINLLCDYGATPSFDFTPTTGWKVNTVFYNSTDVTSSLVNGVYTVPTITANALLNVSFVSITTGAPELINNRIKVYSTNSEIFVEGTSNGETVTLYTVNGKQIQNIISKGERLNLQVDRDAVYLLKAGQKTFKVIL